MVEGYVAHYRIPLAGAELRREALEWATTRGARSGRVAWQYVQDLAGRLGVKTDDGSQKSEIGSQKSDRISDVLTSASSCAVVASVTPR